MNKKGQVFPDRREQYKDSRSGRTVWRMTHTPGGTSHAQYFTQPATTPDGRWLIYGSDQAGPPGRLNLFKMDLRSGISIQLTESDKNLKPMWSHISPDGNEVYFIEDTAHVKSVNLHTLEERSICRVENCFRAHQLSVSLDNRFLTDGFFFEDKKEDDFLKDQGFLIDGGYGKIKGTTFRVSNMGDETEATMGQLFAAMDNAMKQL